ncbi:MAG TPA: PQQ-binding-like beta-propeller repeat protein [Chloroflexota bacterium]|nr:PQQ-binding-like beta-propeller repeat protein [Chloroflexota bacterium]
MRTTLWRGAAVGLVASLVLAGAAQAGSPQTAASRTKAAAAGNVDWPLFGNTTNNTRYSPLTQITASNVSRLGYAWTQAQGAKLTTLETDPIVVNGIMYYTTNTDQVRAVNAATGALRWQYSPKVNFYLAMSGGGAGVPTNRGVTVANGRVYLLTFDNQLTSLQASTGEVLWHTQVADPNQGYSETSPATYWNGLLFVGSAESDSGRQGFVAAYNATTGKQVWRYFTIPNVGQGWRKTAAVSGGDVWMPQVIDAKTGILYFGTGNPWPDATNSKRPGCDPWTDATVALNARTGKFIWAHSEVCNDVYDYDSHQPPMIFDVTINGKTTHAVGHGNKSGLYFIYNAATGAVLAKTGYLGKYSHPKGAPTCPGPLGGLEFSPPAFSPQTHMAYEPGLEACVSFSQLTSGKLPKINASGYMVGIDTATGKIAWKTATPAPMLGGAVATASGLVFAGSHDGNFYAFDAKTGKIVWKTNVGLSFGAAPITYEVNGTQYIAVAAGGLSAGATLLPGAKIGGTLVVFKLNGKPVTKLPIVEGKATSGLSEAVSVKGMTPVGPWMYVDTKTHRVVFKVVAASNSTNNGFNFDGYAKGKANFIVPTGWIVNFIFTNHSPLAHSMAVVPTLKLNASVVPLAATPKANQGVGANVTQYAGFTAYAAGKDYLACLVPGHILAGMWDNFTISATATMPSIQVQ